jgi:hypothetical protein
VQDRTFVSRASQLACVLLDVPDVGDFLFGFSSQDDTGRKQ